MTHEKQKLVIEPLFPIKVPNPIGQIIVVGCGGNGGYLLPLLARSLSTLGRVVDVVLIDGDKVEEKNLKRQNFILSDIGRNKAEVLATRYSALGLQLGFVDKYLETAEELTKMLMNGKVGSKLIVSCVDNVKTRALIRAAYLNNGATGTHHYWIDMGNEEFSGQSVLSVNPYGWMGDEATTKRGLYPVPDVFDLYPELLERAKQAKLPSELSCAELAESSPQYGFVNATAAVLSMNWIHDLLANPNGVNSHTVNFTTGNQFSHEGLNESEVIRWFDFFAPIRTAAWIKNAAKIRQQAADQKREAALAEALKKEKLIPPADEGKKKRSKKKTDPEVKEKLLDLIKTHNK